MTAIHQTRHSWATCIVSVLYAVCFVCQRLSFNHNEYSECIWCTHPSGVEHKVHIYCLTIHVRWNGQSIRYLWFLRRKFRRISNRMICRIHASLDYCVMLCTFESATIKMFIFPRSIWTVETSAFEALNLHAQNSKKNRRNLCESRWIEFSIFSSLSLSLGRSKFRITQQRLNSR